MNDPGATDAGATPDYDDATLTQFVIHQPDAIELQRALIAAEWTRQVADTGPISSGDAPALHATRDAVFDLTKKLVAVRLELEYAKADQAELAALRSDAALLTRLELEALEDPIYLHNGSEEALSKRSKARGLGFGPAFGRTLRDALSQLAGGRTA